MSRSKRYRLGPQLHRAASDPAFFDQVHVLFGGTGAVGGATALQMIGFIEEAAAGNPAAAGRSPRLVVTGRSKAEVRQFTRLLFDLQQRDHGRLPEALDHMGYRTVGGVTLELTVLGVDPAIPGLQDFGQRDEAGRGEAIRQFLAGGGLAPESPDADKARYLEDVLRQRVGRPFSRFLEDYLAERGPLPGGRERFRSVVVGIPLASVAAYKLADLDEAGPFLGVARGSSRLDELKEIYLAAMRDDLANVRDRLAEEVLAAHTTAVGGMYDEEEDGSRTIRLGFAHSAIDDKLRKKQIFAEELARLYAEKQIKMLVTAAAIGVDAVLVRESPPMNGAIRRQLARAHAEGNPVIHPSPPAHLAVYPPVDLDLLAEPHEPVAFQHGRPLVLDYVLKSGENGYFTIPNADALYRVMRVTTGSELGLLLARTAVFGDDPHFPMFPNSACYYTETDNSRQVFDLLGQPRLRRNQQSGLQPKALQDLGSAKHQAELHTLGLLILLHRLKTLDFDVLPPQVDLAEFQPERFFESRSRALTLENVLPWTAAPLARDLRLLVRAREEKDLAPLKHFYQSHPDRQEAAHRTLRAALHAVWAIPSIGTPLVYEEEGRRRVVTGYYAASLDRVVTHRDTFATHLRRRFEALGGGNEGDFDLFVDFHVANFGFADLRPVAVLVTAKSDESWRGNVQVFRDEAPFLAALGRLEPYSYFTTSGLVALLVRLRGLCRLAHQLEPRLGTANEFRAHLPFDELDRPLLIPGIVEAFRMVSEGLEKNTGAERLDGRWGYYV
ncbi:MAG TPA: hypothetical protein VF173_00975 [Thermoanaerobaculia bacterium]|nr:hypothetical protein [Thermoanaerobaculia bacterium]